MRKTISVVILLMLLLVFMAPAALAGPADEPLWTAARSQTIGDDTKLHKPVWVEGMRLYLADHKGLHFGQWHEHVKNK